MGNILYSYMPENANKQHHGRNVIVFGNTMQQLGATCLLEQQRLPRVIPSRVQSYKLGLHLKHQ